METKENEEDMEDNKPKLWTPQVIQGGKTGGEPPRPPSKTWLRELPIGTIFFAKDQTAPHPLAEEYVLKDFTESKNTALLNYSDHRGDGRCWVCVEDFEKRFKLLDIMGISISDDDKRLVHDADVEE